MQRSKKGKNMNKKELITYLTNQFDINKYVVKEIVETSFTKIIEELAKGNSVHIVGFGAFEVRRRIARIGRNPKTGKEMQLPSTKTPVFKPGKPLKDAVKGRK